MRSTTVAYRSAWRIVPLLMTVVCLPALVSAKAADIPLLEAVRDVDREAVRALLDQGVDVNVTAVDGATALHWAVYRDEPRLVASLIEGGADVIPANRYGVRPLSLASLNGNAEIIEQLIRAGADLLAVVGGLFGGPPEEVKARARTFTRLFAEHHPFFNL